MYNLARFSNCVYIARQLRITRHVFFADSGGGAERDARGKRFDRACITSPKRDTCVFAHRHSRDNEVSASAQKIKEKEVVE